MPGSNPGSPVTPDYASSFPSTGTLHSVTVDVSGDLIDDGESEMRMAMAMAVAPPGAEPGRSPRRRIDTRAPRVHR